MNLGIVLMQKGELEKIFYVRMILIEIRLLKNGMAIAIATAASRSIPGPEADIGVAMTSPPKTYCGFVTSAVAIPTISITVSC